MLIDMNRLQDWADHFENAYSMSAEDPKVPINHPSEASIFIFWSLFARSYSGRNSQRRNCVRIWGHFDAVSFESTSAVMVA